ncbi:polyphosphate kinase 1 [Flexithrix dorotheae]|uniref:polyphosphate kinase 1 n=1 Tax=Flexithrix dorotheae TaxID=70993 RepID=UPI0005C4F0E4|nr:polyphosphate kinase 1 [Flexithrix dorotheae]
MDEIAEKPEKVFSYYNRDLSWLSFNYRVLMEAADPEVPLYERIKFLAIFSSNLDEFFRVRVASLRSILKLPKKKIKKKLDFKPKAVFHAIQETVGQHQREFGVIFRDGILPVLKENGIVLYQDAITSETHKQFIRKYFKNRVLAFLQPVVLSKNKVPFLNNRELYFALELTYLKNQEAEKSFAILNIPSDHLPRFIQLPAINGIHYYIFLDDIIRENLDLIFPGYEVNGCYSIKINRDADLLINDEFSGDLVDKIKKHLSKRNIGVPSRFLFDLNMPEGLQQFLKENLELSDEDMVPGGKYHNFNDLLGLPNPQKPALENLKLNSLDLKELDDHKTFFEAILKKDYLLHFPYQSYDYVLQFFNEAAIDPYVSKIQLTVYRIAANSFIANALISAAKNGKDVTVFVEVKARFDEANNLKWARLMEEAGVKIMYSIPGLKVHAKIALITREIAGEEQEFAFLGTGNFNESTAKIYADHGLFTSNAALTKELRGVFHFLNNGEKPQLSHLLVAQVNLQESFLELIDNEIRLKASGLEAFIKIKLNNLEDEVMIDKLYEASNAGVKIDLIVRGICCLVPGVENQGENITVTRVVDQFLEHARAFVFGNGGETKVILGSSDWMKRNLYHRVEVCYPIFNEALKAEILQILDFQLQDNSKAVTLNAEQENCKKQRQPLEKECRSQVAIYHYLKEKSH